MSKQIKRLQLPLDVGCLIPDSPASMTGFIVEEQGDWFEHEMSAMRRIVRPGMRCVDVGAGYGVYALQMSKIVGATGKVHAVEPQNEMADLLRRAGAEVAGGGELLVHQVALSGQDAHDLALTTPDDPELAVLSTEGDREVEITTLDELIDGSVDFLKLDAEGHERQILSGADRLLACPDVILEVAIRGGGALQVKLADDLLQRGFCLFRAIPGLGTIAPIRFGDPIDSFMINVFALRPHTARQLHADGLIAGCVLESDLVSTGVKVQAVLDRLLAEQPFTGLKLNWQPNAIHPGWEAQRRAVALAAESQMGHQSVDQRMAGLLSAYRSSKHALAQAITGSRLFTFSRIAWNLGWQVEALQAIEKLTQIVDSRKEDIGKTFTEPMLLPLPGLDAVRYPDLQALVVGSVVESMYSMGSYSVFFNRGATSVILERLRGLQARSARAQRTISLLERQVPADRSVRV